jgi:hypothetical protein
MHPQAPPFGCPELPPALDVADGEALVRGYFVREVWHGYVGKLLVDVTRQCDLASRQRTKAEALLRQRLRSESPRSNQEIQDLILLDPEQERLLREQRQFEDKRLYLKSIAERLERECAMYSRFISVREQEARLHSIGNRAAAVRQIPKPCP